MKPKILDSATPQTFVDALRRGDFALASCFEGWARKKYKELAGTGLPEDTNNLIAILLTQTNFAEEDVIPLMAAFDSSKNFYQANIMVLFNGAQAYLNFDVSADVLRNKFLEISKSENPNQALHDYIELISPKSVRDISLVDSEALGEFKKRNQKTIEQVQARAEYLLGMFNVADNYRLFITSSTDSSPTAVECHNKVQEMIDILKNASLYSVNDLMKELDERVDYINKHGPKSKEKDQLIKVLEYEEIKTKITDYLTILHNNPVKESEKNPKLVTAYNNRLQAGQNMLLSLYQGKPRQELMQDLERHIKTIEKNKPGLAELGFIGWIKNLFGMNIALSSEQDKFKETIQKLKESREAENKIDNGPIFS